MPIVFTKTQNTLIARSITCACFLLLCACIGVMFILLLKSMMHVVHIVGPVILGFFLSILTKPVYNLILKYVRLPGLAILLFALSFAIPIVILSIVGGHFVMEQVQNLIENLPGWVMNLQSYVVEHYPVLKPFILESSQPLLDAVHGGSLNFDFLWNLLKNGVAYGGSIMSAGSVMMLWLLTFLYWPIFVMKNVHGSSDIALRLPFLSLHARRVIAEKVDVFIELLVSYFRGQIIDVTIQGLFYAIAFSIAGLPSGFLIGFLMGWLNLIPYVGVTIGLLIALPLAFISGGLTLVIVILILFVCMQSFDGYVMQPWIQGQRMKLSSWQIVFSLLFWTQLCGFFGLLLAIPITAFIKTIWDGVLNYTRQLAASEDIGKFDERKKV